MTIDATFLRLQANAINAKQAKVSIEVPPEVFEFMKTQASRGEYTAFIPCETTMGFPSWDSGGAFRNFVDAVAEKLEELGFYTRQIDLLNGRVCIFADWAEHL